MKYIATIIFCVTGLWMLPGSSPAISTKPVLTDSVYICNSEGSTAYHSHECSGLSKCKHEVKKLSLKEAINLGYEKPCGFCYK